jgi:MFS family permease
MSLLIVDDPRDHEIGADGEALDANVTAATSPGASVKEALQTRQFIGLYAACLICGFGVFVPFVHLVPFAVDHHISQGSAVLLLGAIGVGSTVGRFLLGSLADRLGRQSFLVAMFVGMAASLAVWMVATGFWLLGAFALLFGGFYGGWVAILPAVVTDYFGGRNASGIIGILYTSVAIGTLVGPSAAGFVFDIRHSYMLPIAASIVANVIAAVIAARTARTTAPITTKRAASCGGCDPSSRRNPA